MAVINPPGYLHNASPAVASGQMDRLISNTAKYMSGAADLLVKGGVRSFNELKVSPQGTPNMTVSVSAGIAIVQGTRNATQGAYVFMNDGPVSLTIAAANATNPRRDLIIARIYDSQYAGATDTSALEVVTGTASASPVDPTVPSDALILARITVPANDTAVNTGDITDLRKFVAAPGGTIPVLNQADRDALTKFPGLSVYRLDTETVEVWNATAAAWNGQASSSGSSGITAATGWSIVTQSWILKNGYFQFWIRATRTGTSIAGGSTGNINNIQVATIPAGQRPPISSPAASIGDGQMIHGYVAPAGGIFAASTVPNGSIANNELISLAGGYML